MTGETAAAALGSGVAISVEEGVEVPVVLFPHFFSACGMLEGKAEKTKIPRSSWCNSSERSTPGKICSESCRDRTTLNNEWLLATIGTVRAENGCIGTYLLHLI